MRIYFAGIGGVGIGPLAQIALDADYDVTGSDAQPSAMTQQLQDRSVTISFAQDGHFLRTEHQRAAFDLFVYTSSLPSDHPELVMARQLGIKTAKRDELLVHLLKDKGLQLIAVAGTHGKTTTTGMLIWALKQLNVPISYSVGTTISYGPSGQYSPQSRYFIYECDEFDRNFLHFTPALSLITSIDYDHSDTYPTITDYRQAFSQFMAQSSQVYMWQGDQTDGITTPDLATVLTPSDQPQSITLAGEHNRKNAVLAVKAITSLNLGDEHAAITAVNSFPGTGRRFEKLAENLYTDYGHHPREIAATLQMARELSPHTTLVYQPHQNIRQHEIKDDYTDTVFAGADDVYWLPTYLTREDPHLEVLTPQQLTAHLAETSIHSAELDDTLWQAVSRARDDGSLVLFMGAGPIDGWVRQQINAAA